MLLSMLQDVFFVNQIFWSTVVIKGQNLCSSYYRIKFVITRAVRIYAVGAPSPCNRLHVQLTRSRRPTAVLQLHCSLTINYNLRQVCKKRLGEKLLFYKGGDCKSRTSYILYSIIDQEFAIGDHWLVCELSLRIRWLFGGTAILALICTPFCFPFSNC